MSNQNFKIGITERGDAGLDFSWRDTFIATEKRAILITKRLSEKFRKAVMEEMQNGANLIIHATITGLGGTEIEPGVITPEESLQELVKLVNDGFPKNRIILRVDPIIPGFEHYAQKVLDKALELDLLPEISVKVSVLDMYKHARERFDAAHVYINMPYFTASEWQFRTIDSMLDGYAKKGVKFTSCNEPKLTTATPAGCVGEAECAIMGITPPNMGTNPQNHGNCLCLCGCKTELLTHKNRCPHGCLYCYWKD